MLLLGGAAAVAAAGGLNAGPAAAQTDSAIAHTFPSRCMNATDTKLVTIAKGAMVTEDTAAYWNLPEDSPQRASYDRDIVVKAAEGVWTFGPKASSTPTRWKGQFPSRSRWAKASMSAWTSVRPWTSPTSCRSPSPAASRR